jgi:hypothetical protein
MVTVVVVDDGVVVVVVVVVGPPNELRLLTSVQTPAACETRVAKRRRVRRAAVASLGVLVCCGSEQLPKIFREAIIPHMYVPTCLNLRVCLPTCRHPPQTGGITAV